LQGAQQQQTQQFVTKKGKNTKYREKNLIKHGGELCTKQKIKTHTHTTTTAIRMKYVIDKIK